MKTMGLASIVGALTWTGADVDRAARLVRQLEESGGAQQFTPKFFTPDEWRTVRVLVDDVIPRDSRSGSATDAKVPEYMDFMLTDDQQNVSQQSRNAMRTGIAWMDTESTKRFQMPYAGCTDAQRHQILDDIAFPARATPAMMAGATFFNRFRDMTASGFFSSAIGWKDLGYLGNVAVPTWNGCPDPVLKKLGVTYDVMKTRVPIQYEP
jgi:hypothetical protein